MHTGCTIAGLPEEMRSDMIVMEITFADGGTDTRAGGNNGSCGGDFLVRSLGVGRHGHLIGGGQDACPCGNQAQRQRRCRRCTEKEVCTVSRRWRRISRLSTAETKANIIIF